MSKPSLALAGLLVASLARADGLSFDGDEPRFPHAWLELDAAQRAHLRDGEGGVSRTVELTRSQRASLRAQTGADAPWLFVRDRAEVEQECTCGAYNLSVRMGARLVVLAQALGDYLPPWEAVRITRSLADPALATPPPDPPPMVASIRGEVPPLLERARALLPEARFRTSLAAAGGWQIVRVRHAPLPELVEDPSAMALDLTSEQGVEALASGAAAAIWPDTGARRLEPDGTAIYVVPHVLQGELGPSLRAWPLLAYRGGRLVEHAVVGEEDLQAGATYDWSSEPSAPHATHQ